jgi:HEAT repeat protein
MPLLATHDTFTTPRLTRRRAYSPGKIKIMKQELSGQDIAVQQSARREGSLGSRSVRLGLVAALGTSLTLFLHDIPQAQQRFKEPSVRVTGVTTSGNVVSISADGSLGRAQTWQDPQGFHVVVVNGQADLGGSVRGVRVQRVGNSLELIVPVKQGASVTVQPRGNRLDLVVSGGTGGALSVENFPTDARAEGASKSHTREVREQASQETSSRAVPPAALKRRGAAEAAPVAATPPTDAQASKSRQDTQRATNAPANPQAAPAGLNESAPPEGEPTIVGERPASENPLNVAAAPSRLQADSGFDFKSFVLSLPGLLIMLGVLMAGAAAFIFRRGRKRSDEFEEVENTKSKSLEKVADKVPTPFQQFRGDRRKASIAVPFERRNSGRGAEDEASRQQFNNGATATAKNAEQSERADAKVSGTAAHTVQFSPYRIDQEVGRLVEGRSHSIEVLSSRAADDRRAVETSLLKALRSPEADEDGRRRARTALEDYGFVARSCASLLLGAESFQRATSARSLGEMRSAQALPFLTEALYDPDSVVRMECVQSLGALGLPSAIGALLDVATRHPDIPANVLGPALTACSVESLELSLGSTGESPTLAGDGEDEYWFAGEVYALRPAGAVEELPEWVENETLRGAFERIAAADVEARVLSAQQLAQFQVRRAVEALAAMSRRDADASVRSAAVTSLGLIDHESVFASVIVALADEAREVRAAAARALSRLSFDRATAYVRVVEAANESALREVAQACVKAGLTAQAISRLASEDRRQAYEAYSLLSLVARGGEHGPLLETVECHRDLDVRLACIRVLGQSCSPELVEQLTHIAENGGVPEKVRRAIVELAGRAAQPQAVTADQA